MAEISAFLNEKYAAEPAAFFDRGPVREESVPLAEDPARPMAAAFLLVCACSRSGEGEIHDIGIGSMNGPNGSYEPKYPIVTDDPNSATVKLDENYTMPVNTTEVIDLGDGEAAITWPEEWSDFFGITPDPNATGTPEPTETAVPATTAPAETDSSTPEPTATPEGPTPEPTIDDGEGDWFGDF